MGAIRRRGWWYLVGVSVLLVLFGVLDVATGAAADPAIALGLTGLTLDELRAQDPAGYRLFDFFTRTQGILLVVSGALLTVILVIPYRAGRRWAWWTAWVLPAWTAAVTAAYLAVGVDPSQPPPPPLVSGPLLGGIAVLVLLLDRRRFWSDAPERAAA